ncbi:MAG: type II toxin-antitoxin system HicB family antitoxin [Chloroflexi bacterium]|nr:type II toxin-antitoxin system HicB family antitoxin [Chloroflexota bacterium]
MTLKHEALSRIDQVKEFQVVVTRDEDGVFVASCPSLPGCHTQGDTVEEALANIQEGIALFIEVLNDDESVDLPVANSWFANVSLTH